jgi:hypothetical protein
MTICPLCGEEVQDMDVIFHKCAPNPENGKPKQEQKFHLLDFLKEWWRYSIFTPSFSGRKYQHDEENKFDFLKWLLYNTTTIIIPIWLLTVLISGYVIGQLGIVLGLTFLISPPLLIWFAWKLKLKRKDTYAILFSIGHVLIIMVYILLILSVVFISY